jgi:hypothetical protein
MKCPKCGNETDRFYIFEPTHLVGILTKTGEHPSEDVQMPNKLKPIYTCPNCLETVTENEDEAYEMIGASLEKFWAWSYRDGEITGTVRANTWEEAFNRVINDWDHWNLHADMFEVSEYSEVENNDDSVS